MFRISKYVFEVLVLSLAFLIPVFPNFVPITITLLLLFWILDLNFKSKFVNLFTSKTGLIFIAFYLLYVVGLIYTSLNAVGRFDLEVKLSLLIFPLLMLTGTEKIDRIELSRILKIFVLGCLVISMFLLIRAFYFYNQTKEIGQLTYGNLSYLMHPSYLAMYINFSIVIVFMTFFEEKVRTLYLVLKFLLLAFFILVILLLSSKAGILCLLLAILLIFLYLLVKRKYLIVSIASVLFVLLVTLTIKYNRVGTERIKTAIDVMMNYKSISSHSDESTSDRILIWKASTEIIKKNPILGVGTGDVKMELLKEYKVENIPFAIEKNLNAHNQYLQTAVAIGIPGLIVLLLCFLVPLYWSIKNDNWLYSFFILLILVNLLFESMFERQAGVVFYAFFNALLFSRMYNEMRMSGMQKTNMISGEK